MYRYSASETGPQEGWPFVFVCFLSPLASLKRVMIVAIGQGRGWDRVGRQVTEQGFLVPTGGQAANGAARALLKDTFWMCGTDQWTSLDQGGRCGRENE